MRYLLNQSEAPRRGTCRNGYMHILNFDIFNAPPLVSNDSMLLGTYKFPSGAP